MDFKNLEDLCTYMLVEIRLSRYDLQFVNNLLTIINRKNAVTSNQDNLFRKIALKYRRQFTQQNVDIDSKLSLLWKADLIESLPQYTNASIVIDKDKIIFRSPFNKAFLSALKKKPIYSMEWDREKRQYEIQYGVTTLRELLAISSDHYPVINYCDITKQIIDSLSEYESIKYWVPTLVYNNGHYYVAACNSIVYDCIKNIPQTNDLRMVADYVQYGIKIDNSVIEHFNKFEDPLKVKFATEYYAIVELSDLVNMCTWLHELGCDAIAESFRPAKQAVSYTESYKKALDKMQISATTIQSDLSIYKKPVMIHHRTYGIIDTPTPLFKMIKCVNSEPVNLGIK